MNRSFVLTVLALALCATGVRAGGFAGREPASYDATIYVDGAAAQGGDGSEAKPLASLRDGVARVQKSLKEGRSTKLLVKPGVYRESLPTIGCWMKGGDGSQNEDLKFQDAWLRVDRWGDKGEVVISGSDDWSAGKGEGGKWQAVEGRPGVFCREWKYNWGPWGGSKGTANVSGTAGQRREMVFVDLGDGKGVRRLTQVVLEKFNHEKPSDTGNAGSWWGPGTWTYDGYAGLDALPPLSFGVTELSADDADNPQPEEDWTKHQDGSVVMKGADGKPCHIPFKQVFEQTKSRAPASEANKIFIRLPDGCDIAKARVWVAMRTFALRIEGKRNVVLANFTVEHFNPPMFEPAMMLGRASHNWWLTSGNTLCENLVFRQNNANGLDVAGMMGATFRACRFEDNGASGLSPTYCYDLKLERCTFERSGWRAHGLGHSYTFIPGGMKTWNTTRLELDGCVFADNFYKGFYSDNALPQAVFHNCIFRGNLVGSMHEIARGPIRYENCAFERNQQGLAVIQASGVAVDGCTFADNVAAVVPEAKPRQACTMKADYAWGDSLLINEESPVNLDNFAMTRCRLVSSVRGARLVVQGSRYSDAKWYWEKMTKGAKFEGNTYGLAEHPFAFEGPNGFLDFAAWTAATAEKDGRWDAAAAPRKAGPAIEYPAGFVWKRSADWQNVSGGESDVGRVVTDARGGSPWALRLVPSGVEVTGLGGAKPWYAQPMDHMSFRSGEKAAYRAANIDHGWPWANATGIGVTAWKADYVYGTPAVEWANPAGRPITIGITGTLRLRWGEKGLPKNVHVAIVHAKADGSQTLLRGEACKRPETAVTELPVTLSGIALGPADRILISLFIAEGAAYGSNAILDDDLTLHNE
jgi:hypothetical protein